MERTSEIYYKKADKAPEESIQLNLDNEQVQNYMDFYP